MLFCEVFNTICEGAGGKIVQNVNTTIDVHMDSIKKETAKFGNNVSYEGVPPSYEYSNIAKSLFEIGIKKDDE